ncbi:MAG: hypothetical protein JJU34_05005 [Lunatimonas sp.]|uniref:hypothetical protein n=1 Tax=Lunatimonas sp. TaxID=2060141 RepID=UPI00263A49D4|nr:hypothetical protein [Lunatimonas sp.]MCC5936618.1 hypothetical protein [Lunatimonas sp.]
MKKLKNILLMLAMAGFILGTGLSACGGKKTDGSSETTEHPADGEEHPAEESEHPSEHPTEKKEHPSN